jgi:phosphate transport system ATP-binding protein
MDGMTPPPIRRIDLESRPRAVPAPPANGNGTTTGAPMVARPPRRDEGGPERMRTEDLTIAYGNKVAVDRVGLPVRKGEVLALIGPSGCGKTTLLRSLNRLTELTPGAVRLGRIVLDGRDVDELEVTELRRRVSMVFQQPNPFPMSVFDNVAYALREQGSRRPKRAALEPDVVDALRRAGLFEEVKDNLSHPALRLSGGQQQRLCIARALAAGPEVLLLDEPCSALDPRSTQVIEELLLQLRSELAVVIVTHNLQQAQRVADRVAFMFLGELIEFASVDQIFGAPQHKRTRDYVSGAFG